MAMLFGKNQFHQQLVESIGLKSGLVLTGKDFKSALSENNYQLVRESLEGGQRIYSTEFEEIFYALLSYVGITSEPYDRHNNFQKFTDKYDNLSNYNELFNEINNGFHNLLSNGTPGKPIAPTKALMSIMVEYGHTGAEMFIDYLRLMQTEHELNPYSLSPASGNYKNLLELETLFSHFKKVGESNYFDQRFIDFLSKNPDILGKIHWRKFEEMIAEFYDREGYGVEIGKGSDDDGVDIRVWKENATTKTTGIIQCKRTKSKVEKVIVKGLYADMLEYDADFGVIATSSELAPGAKGTITSRNYPIQYAEKKHIIELLNKFRKPFIDQF